MSLISEALRKARQEAAEKDAEKRGIASPPATKARNRLSGQGVALLIGAAIALAAALSGGAVAWWALGLRGDSHTPTEATHQTQAGSPQAPTGPREELAEHATTAAETKPRPAAAAEGNAEELPIRDPFTLPEQYAHLEAGAQQSPDEDEDYDEEPIVEVSRDTIFLVDADLGYARLSIGFLVYSETNAFAEINGQEVRVGSMVDGFEVITIERDRVTLSDEKGPVVIRVP